MSGIITKDLEGLKKSINNYCLVELKEVAYECIKSNKNIALSVICQTLVNNICAAIIENVEFEYPSDMEKKFIDYINGKQRYYEVGIEILMVKVLEDKPLHYHFKALVINEVANKVKHAINKELEAVPTMEIHSADFVKYYNMFLGKMNQIIGTNILDSLYLDSDINEDVKFETPKFNASIDMTKPAGIISFNHDENSRCTLTIGKAVYKKQPYSLRLLDGTIIETPYRMTFDLDTTADEDGLINVKYKKLLFSKNVDYGYYHRLVIKANGINVFTKDHLASGKYGFYIPEEVLAQELISLDCKLEVYRFEADDEIGECEIVLQENCIFKTSEITINR